ncbi:MAG: nicotinate (nicotinamide) nucleotide adenylyltransferase [Bacillales bacterium]|nr:nicotinate (nicotinamide) nucleotide adenylyltransferase [Bacillales bacterium]
MQIIFGGSFNPPTIAHLEIYKFVKERINFDKFVFLPVSTVYHKNNLVSNEDRYNMLKLMTQNYDDIIISRDEFDDKKYLGTYHYLKSQKEESFFLIGSDNLRDLETWIEFEKLVSEFHFIVISRDNSDDESYIKHHHVLKNHINNFIILKGFNISISSSEFRLTHRKKIVDKKVYDYIEEKHLYGGTL